MKSYGEQQVSCEEALEAEPVIPQSGLQPHPVSLRQSQHRVPAGRVPTGLENPEAVKHLLAIPPQVHMRDEQRKVNWSTPATAQVNTPD